MLIWLWRASPDRARALYEETGLTASFGIASRKPISLAAHNQGNDPVILGTSQVLNTRQSDALQSPSAFAVFPDYLGFTAWTSASRKLWPPSAPTRLEHKYGIRRANFSPCGEYIVTSGRKGPRGAEAFLWNVRELVPDYEPKIIACHEDDIYGCEISSDSLKIIVTTGFDAAVWHITGNTARLRHEKDVSDVAFSPDNSLIATTSWDGKMHIWDSRTYKLRATYAPKLPKNHIINAAHFSPDCTSIVVGSSDGSVVILDANTLEQIRSLDGYKSEGVCCVRYSPDGHFIAVSSYIGTAAIFDARTGTLIRILGENVGHIDTVWSAMFSSDGSRLVTASEDRIAYVWDVATGEILFELPHPDALYAAYFSPDDRTVLTACDDRSAYLWTIA